MKSRSTRMTVAVWVLSALLFTLYVDTGTKKILPELRGSQQTTVAHFREWGYSDGFRVFIGSAEIAGAAGLLLPPVAAVAAVALVPIMLGATYNHVVHGDPIGKAIVPVIVMAILGFIAFQRRRDLLQFPAQTLEDTSSA